jgi:restriction system protein
VFARKQRVIHCLGSYRPMAVPPTFWYCSAALATAACGWLLYRRHRSEPTAATQSTEARSGVAALTVREFEARVGRAFQSQGYQLVGTGPDGHSDLVLRRDRQTFLVVCKHWQKAKVGVDAVQALHRAMNARGAAGGFMLTTGRFGREAVTFASGCNIRLVGANALEALLASLAPADSGGAQPLR